MISSVHLRGQTLQTLLPFLLHHLEDTLYMIRPTALRVRLLELPNQQYAAVMSDSWLHSLCPWTGADYECRQWMCMQFHSHYNCSRQSALWTGHYCFMVRVISPHTEHRKSHRAPVVGSERLPLNAWQFSYRVYREFEPQTSMTMGALSPPGHGIHKKQR